MFIEGFSVIVNIFCRSVENRSSFGITIFTGEGKTVTAVSLIILLLYPCVVIIIHSLLVKSVVAHPNEAYAKNHLSN